MKNIFEKQRQNQQVHEFNLIAYLFVNIIDLSDI